MLFSCASVAPSGGGTQTVKHRCTGDHLTRGALRELPTFERGDHAGAPLLQEALELLPGSLQRSVVLDVAAQVPVILHEQAVPGQAASLAVRTEHTQFMMEMDSWLDIMKAPKIIYNMTRYKHFIKVFLIFEISRKESSTSTLYAKLG